MSKKLNKVIAAILAILFLGLTFTIIYSVNKFEDKSRHCAVKGGVMLRISGGWGCFDVKEIK